MRGPHRYFVHAFMAESERRNTNRYLGLAPQPEPASYTAVQQNTIQNLNRLAVMYLTREARTKGMSAYYLYQLRDQVYQVSLSVTQKLYDKIAFNKEMIKKRATGSTYGIYDGKKKMYISDLKSIAYFYNGLLSMDEALAETNGGGLHAFINYKVGQKPEMEQDEVMLGSSKKFSHAAMERRRRQGGQDSMMGQVDVIEMYKQELDQEKYKYQAIRSKAIQNASKHKTYKYTKAVHDMTMNFLKLVVVSTIGLFVTGLGAVSGVLASVAGSVARSLAGLLYLMGSTLANVSRTIANFFSRLFQFEEVYIVRQEIAAESEPLLYGEQQALEQVAAPRQASIQYRSQYIAEELKEQGDASGFGNVFRYPDLVQKYSQIEQTTSRMIQSMTQMIGYTGQAAAGAQGFQMVFNQMSPGMFEVQRQGIEMLEGTFQDLGMNAQESEFLATEITMRARDYMGMYNDYYANLLQAQGDDSNFDRRMHSQAYADVLNTLFLETFHNGEETYVHNNAMEEAYDSLYHELGQTLPVDYQEYGTEETYDMALNQMENQGTQFGGGDQDMGMGGMEIPTSMRIGTEYVPGFFIPSTGLTVMGRGNALFR